MRKICLLFIIVFFFTGCDKGGGSAPAGPAAQCSKAILNTWTGIGFSAVFVLGGLEFDAVEKYDISFSGGAQCEYDILISGTNCIGTVSLFNGLYLGGGTDPDCSLLNGNNTYNITGAEAIICDMASPYNCENYQ